MVPTLWPANNANNIVSFRVRSLKEMLLLFNVARYFRTTFISQMITYRGLGGLILKTPFKKRLTNGWSAKERSPGINTTLDKALLAVEMAL